MVFGGIVYLGNESLASFGKSKSYLVKASETVPIFLQQFSLFDQQNLF